MSASKETLSICQEISDMNMLNAVSHTWTLYQLSSFFWVSVLLRYTNNSSGVSLNVSFCLHGRSCFTVWIWIRLPQVAADHNQLFNINKQTRPQVHRVIANSVCKHLFTWNQPHSKLGIMPSINLVIIKGSCCY